MKIINYTTTESTNDDVVALGENGYPHLTTVVAEYQTKGRGRRGNEWISARGTNLLFSILIRSEADTSLWGRIPQIAGMEFIRTVESEFSPNESITMKWPNDLFFADRKWAGILVESRLGNENSFAVLGMGVNCLGRAEEYSSELQGSVVTLQEIFELDNVDRQDLLEKFLVRLDENLENRLIDFETVVEFANRRDYLRGKEIKVGDLRQSITGVASGIGENGALLLVDENGDWHELLGGSVLEIDWKRHVVHSQSYDSGQTARQTFT